MNLFPYPFEAEGEREKGRTGAKKFYGGEVTGTLFQEGVESI
jgi:hypothetical protein